MPEIEEILFFRTSDGEEFEDGDEAEKHQSALDMHQLMKEIMGKRRDHKPGEMARLLIENAADVIEALSAFDATAFEDEDDDESDEDADL